MKIAIYQTSDLHGFVYPTNYVTEKQLGILKIGSYILKDKKNYSSRFFSNSLFIKEES